MNISINKKRFISLLIFSFLFNFLPLQAESNFKPPILNPTLLQLNGFITAIAKDERTGIIYVAQSGGEVKGHLIAIRTDGTQLWNLSTNGSIKIIEISDSIIYIGGQFTKIGMVKRNNLAAIRTNGTVVKRWNPNVNGNVNTLAISDSTIYVGGHFTKIGRTKRNNLAAIGTNGILQDWNPNITSNSLFSDVNALAVNNSTIYIGGRFTKIGGIERNNLAAIGIDGTLQDWNPNVDGYYIFVLTINGPTIYVGGQFTKIGGIERNNLAAIGIDGTLQDWNPNAADAVYNLAISGSTIYVGGQYLNKIGEVPRNYLAAIGMDGTLEDWNPNPNSQVLVLSINGSTLYVGGVFTTIANEPRANFASFNIPGETP